MPTKTQEEKPKTENTRRSFLNILWIILGGVALAEFVAVAFAFQCGLFNIGGEGQMIMGGFALTWVGFTFTGLPWVLLIPLCVLAGMFAGGLWGAIPGYLKAKRGVHEVVTTIMLNWIAVAFTQYLTMAFKPPDSWIPHTYEIAKSARLSRLWVYLNPLGIDFPKSNLSLCIAGPLGMEVRNSAKTNCIFKYAFLRVACFLYLVFLFHAQLQAFANQTEIGLP